MSIYNSRTAQPVSDHSRGAAMGTWGLWLALVVLAMFVAGLSAAVLYSHSGQEAWPPQGIHEPTGMYALGSVLLTIAGAVSSSRSLVRVRAEQRRLSAVALAASTALLGAAVLLLVLDLVNVGFRWDQHVYTSLYWVMTGMTIFFVGVGALIVGAALIQTVVGLIDQERHLELTNASIYVWFAAGTAAVLLGLVHLLPTTGGGG
jgi:heme/copper-type cytochrome/quinol oxidase subunit 3